MHNDAHNYCPACGECVGECRCPAKGGAALLPCPFCGSSASFSDIKSEKPEFQIGCSNRQDCAFSPYSWVFKTELDAIKAWNKRAECQPKKKSTKANIGRARA